MTLPPDPAEAAPRSVRSAAERLSSLHRAGALDLPEPGTGRTAERWSGLASLGRDDLVVARLAEGHTDAVSVLRQAGREPVPDSLYGVWAARSGGTGAVLTSDVLSGTVRFCSGAHSLDRALVATLTESGDSVLVEVDLTTAGVERDAGSWQAVGMDASDSADVTFHDVKEFEQVGPVGFYTGRPGFWWGGGGVAAVWYGGADGLVGRTEQYLRSGRGADEHQLAHLGELRTALAGTAALLRQTADTIDRTPGEDVTELVWLARGSAEQTARSVVDRVPRIVGPTPLSRDRSFAQALADLQVYVRQHHAERDFAALGRLLLDRAADR